MPPLLIFENAYYVLTPLTLPAWALNSLSEFLSSIGALLGYGRKTHDKIIGAVSHLPHVVAAAL